MTKKYISLDSLKESLGMGVTYDKPVQVANSFYRSVHIEPRGDKDENVKLNGTSATRKVQKQRTSETMTKSMKEEKDRNIPRTEISNVGRIGEKRSENVGRPYSSPSKLTKEAEIKNKIIDEATTAKLTDVIRSAVKEKKEKNKGGKNPLVDTTPKLNHQELDQN